MKRFHRQVEFSANTWILTIKCKLPKFKIEKLKFSVDPHALLFNFHENNLTFASPERTAATVGVI